jgi:DNA-nicking Smr family endonuclease
MSRRDSKRQLPDWHLWTEVARTVSPLRPLRAKPLLNMADGPLPVPEAAPKKPRGLPRMPMPSYQSDGRPGQQPPGRVIEPRMRRRLGRGQVEIDGTIDLHGMRQAEAHAALSGFIHARAARGDRTLLVITGKGLKKLNGDAATIIERGVLRAMLPIWLAEPGLAPLVAGWDISAQGHGGEGAYYVRLRREARK